MLKFASAPDAINNHIVGKSKNPGAYGEPGDADGFQTRVILGTCLAGLGPARPPRARRLTAGQPCDEKRGRHPPPRNRAKPDPKQPAS